MFTSRSPLYFCFHFQQLPSERENTRDLFGEYLGNDRGIHQHTTSERMDRAQEDEKQHRLAKETVLAHLHRLARPIREPELGRARLISTRAALQERMPIEPSVALVQDEVSPLSLDRKERLVLLAVGDHCHFVLESVAIEEELVSLT
jgi:hypothetical protein